MSLISTFVDAFKKAAGKKPDAKELARSSGHLGPTHSGEPFTPLRPAPEPHAGKGATGSDVTVDDVSVGSSDPEEGGEFERPPVDDIAVASADPDEGGEFERPPEPPART